METSEYLTKQALQHILFHLQYNLFWTACPLLAVLNVKILYRNGNKSEFLLCLGHQYGIRALEATEASECFHSQQQWVVEVFHANNEKYKQE